MGIASGEVSTGGDDLAVFELGSDVFVFVGIVHELREYGGAEVVCGRGEPGGFPDGVVHLLEYDAIGRICGRHGPQRARIA
jgi:hypothetical protein